MPPERIQARRTEIGGGSRVARVLPNRRRRMVGAWCFLDHLGPLSFEAGRGLNVGPHPHIGLQTFTWLIEGEVVHRDSLGNEQVIRPGQVNLMSAGRGISHAEDSPSGQGGRLHAVQLWIALDEAHRHALPTFRNYPVLPVVEGDGFRATLLVGEALGRRSPVEVFSPLLGLDIVADPGARIAIPVDPGFEFGVMPLAGCIEVEGETFGPDEMAWLGSGRELVELRCDERAQLVLIGGAPFGESILMWWNFVARTPDEIRGAIDDWQAGSRFGEVRGSPSPILRAPDVGDLRLRKPGD